MKLSLATLFFAAPAAAFAPSASFGVNTALKMSTEAATEKVRNELQNNLWCSCINEYIFCVLVESSSVHVHVHERETTE